jgi:VWFA-related protein
MLVSFQLRSIFALFAAACVLAQNDPAPIRVTTRLVQLNVIALDKSGNPITDLKKEDFSLKDEGKDQDIAAFSLESRAVKKTALLTPPPGQRVFANRPKVEVTGLTVMLFDGLNTKTEDQIRAKQQLIAALSQLGPQERVSLYALGTDLRLLHDFTTDTSSLLKILQKHGARINLEVGDANPDASDTGDDQFDQFVDAANQAYSDYVNVNRAQATLAALEAIAKRVGPIPGRKNLVWISGGFPFSIGFDAPMKPGDTRDRRSFSDEAEKAAKVLNDAQLAVYPVDARGLRTGGLAASSPARANPRNPGANNGSIGPDREYDTMETMAERTGGKAFHNSNDLTRAMLLAVNDAHVTYSLGFYPKNAVWDGKFHKLKLKVDRPGVQVRYRAGYFAFERQSEAPAPVPQTLDEAMVAPSMITGLALTMGLAAETGGYTGTVAVDPRDLKLTQKDGKWTGSLDVQVVQGRAADRKPGIKTTHLELNLSEATYQEAMQRGFQIQTRMQMQPGMDEVRIGVRDANSGAIGTLYLTVH